MRNLRLIAPPLLAALALAIAPSALAGGGDYVFDGGTPQQRAEVRSALEASAFDWNLVPAQVTIHIGAVGASHATRGHIWLDAGLLDSGRFAWAVVQDEYAHQVDYFLFDGSTRERLNGLLGGKDWCYGIAGLRHSEYGCERFSSTLVWSYWTSRDNSYRPTSRTDESAAMEPARFRALLASLIGAPSTVERAAAGTGAKRTVSAVRKKTPKR